MTVEVGTRTAATVRSVAPDDPAVEPTWRRLQAAGGVAAPFSSWEWFAALTAEPATGADVRVLVVDDGTAPIGLLPYERTRDHRGLRSLQPPGAGWLAPDHVEVVAAPTDRSVVAHRAAAHVARMAGHDAVDFAGLDDGALARALDAHLRPPRHLRLPEQRNVLPVVDLTGRPPDRLLSKNSRKQTRRALRDAERAGGGFEVHTDPDAVAAHLPELMDLHDARFGAESEIYTGPARRRFHLRAARSLASRGAVRLYRLAGDGHSLALLYALAHGDRIMAYGGGIRPASGTPGHALTALAMMSAAEEGFAVLDLLRGDSDWKRRFATGEAHDRHVHRLVVRPAAVARAAAWYVRRQARRVGVASP